ncbi:unnamed protein product [Linum trigynum]|uniref:Uncharacterized protein n=1 Tax=Linum trigynum TaxID=586398 RepID=A0AAV2G091_9ROSI
MAHNLPSTIDMSPVASDQVTPVGLVPSITSDGTLSNAEIPPTVSINQEQEAVVIAPVPSPRRSTRDRQNSIKLANFDTSLPQSLVVTESTTPVTSSEVYPVAN